MISIEAAFKLIQDMQDIGKAIILQNDAHETNKVWYVRNYDYDTNHDWPLMSRGWTPDQEMETEADNLPDAIVNFVSEAKRKGYL